MTYYKIISDSQIIDANSVFLKWQSKHDVLLVCDISEAQFIQSSDGETVWRAEWLNRLPDEFEKSRYYPVESVDAAEIAEDEYTTLKEQLDIDGSVSADTSEEDSADSSEDSTDDTEATTEEVMSAAAMRLKIKALESTVADLTEQNDMLTECLLEMSEVVYA